MNEDDSIEEPPRGPVLPPLPEDRTEATRLRMRDLALGSIYYLAKVILGYTKLRPSPHGELCAFIDFLERSRHEGRLDLGRSAIYMPRDTFKTTIATICRAIQRGLRDPGTRGLIVMDTADNAELKGTEISNHFKHNALLRWLFSELIPENFNTVQWSAQAMRLTHSGTFGDPTFTLIGAFGGIESRHFDWIIADDLVVEKHLRSDTEMDKLIHWMGGLEPLLVSDALGWIDLVGSRKKKGDAYEHTEKYYGAGDSPSVSLGPHAEKRGQICVYSRQLIEDNQNIFPFDPIRKSGISNAYIARMRKNEPQRFWAQLMNSPRGTGLNTFRLEDARFFILDQKGLIHAVYNGELLLETSAWALDRRILFDPSVAEKGTSSKQAIHVVAKGSHPFRFVLESHVGHFPPDEAIKLLFELDEKWQPGLISIERRGFQGWVKYALDLLAEAWGRPSLPVVEWPPEGSPKAQWSKVEHIRGLQPIMRAHYLWFQEDQTELLEEIEFYPNVRFDDGLDALAQDLEYAPYSDDEVSIEEKAKKEYRHLVRAGVGGPSREAPWDERAFLRSLDATGYGVRIRTGS